MNIDFVFASIPALSTVPIIGNQVALRIVVGLVTLLKVHGAGVVARGAGAMGSIGETWAHAAIITAMIQIAPFGWSFIQGLIQQFLPFLPV